MKKTEIQIEGMMCEHCVAHVKKALKGVSGVESVNVDLEGKKAVLAVTDDFEPAKAKKAVEEAGYKAL